MSFASHAFGSDEVDLAFNLFHVPIAFAGMEEVYAQTGNDMTPVALLLPVEGEGVEAVSSEIHHGVYLVLYTFA